MEAGKYVRVGCKMRTDPHMPAVLGSCLGRLLVLFLRRLKDQFLQALVEEGDHEQEDTQGNEGCNFATCRNFANVIHEKLHQDQAEEREPYDPQWH